MVGEVTSTNIQESRDTFEHRLVGVNRYLSLDGCMSVNATRTVTI